MLVRAFAQQLKFVRPSSCISALYRLGLTVAHVVDRFYDSSISEQLQYLLRRVAGLLQRSAARSQSRMDLDPRMSFYFALKLFTSICHTRWVVCSDSSLRAALSMTSWSN